MGMPDKFRLLACIVLQDFKSGKDWLWQPNRLEIAVLKG